MKSKYDFYLLLFRLLAVWAWTLFLAGGFLFLLRRVSGAIVPQDWQLPVMGLAACLTSALFSLMTAALFRRPFSIRIRLAIFSWSAVILYLGALLTPSNGALFFLVVLVFSTIHAALWLWSWDLDSTSKTLSTNPTGLDTDWLNDTNAPDAADPGAEPNSGSVALSVSLSDKETEELEEMGDESGLDFPADTQERWTRQTIVKDSDGLPLEELISGWIRLSFAPGQQTEMRNVAFCPPFAETPETNCYLLQGEEVLLNVAQTSPHGTRIELKLPCVLNEPHDIIIEITAQGKPYRA